LHKALLHKPVDEFICGMWACWEWASLGACMAASIWRNLGNLTRLEEGHTDGVMEMKVIVLKH
jgi:hypothetical protein